VRSVRRFVAVSGVLAAVVLGAGACGSTDPDAGALSGKSASQVLSSTLALVQHMGAFHFLDETTGNGPTVGIVGDAGTLVGQQTISGNGPPVQVRVYDQVAYVDGSADVLAGLLGLSAATAADNAGKWISVGPSDPHYASIAHAVTFNAVLAPFIPTGRLTLGGVTTLQGRRVLAVTGSARAADGGGAPGTATLYVSVAAPNLPAGATLVLTNGSQQQHEAAAFTEWGEVVAPSTPRGAIPLSSLTS